MIVSGSQGGLDLIARPLVDPGDPISLEDPGYLGARGAFAGAGARIVPVPVDAEGVPFRSFRVISDIGAIRGYNPPLTTPDAGGVLAGVGRPRLRLQRLQPPQGAVMDPTLAAKAQRFVDLHRAPGAFLIANAWDVASARILEGLGFPALATSSGAAAMLIGRRDGGITRDVALRQAAAMATATTIPLAGDLENGFGHTPEEAALTIQRAAESGLVGGSIEDATNDPAHPIYDYNHAVDRVAAAVEAARALPFPFTLTARAENFLNDRPDLDDTLKRLQAFERAGADVLFAPGLPDLDSVRTVCAAVSKPVNFMVGLRGASFSVAELADAGVKRISLSTSLFRAAMSGLIDSAREAQDQGTFTYLDRILVTGEIQQWLRPLS